LLLSAAPLLAQAPSLPLGTACHSGSGAPPLLGLSSALSVGQSSSLIALNLPAPTVGFLVLGWENQFWNGLSLPLSLAPYGMGACELQLRPDSVNFFFASFSWTQWLLSVPMIPALQGASLSTQVFFVNPDPGAPVFGSTPGLEMYMGPWTTLTQPASQVSQHGITFVFDQPVPVGQFVNGDWFVVGPCNVIDMQPPSVTVSGRVLHGAMINPDPSRVEQGYDSLLYGTGYGQHYQPALNVAGVSLASPLSLVPGQSLVKVKSLLNSPSIVNLQTAVVLTVLDQIPSPGAFRPPYAGSQHQVRFDESMLDWSVLADLQPAAGAPLISDMEPEFERVWLDHSPSWLGRMMHPVENMPNYGRDLAALYGQAVLLANCNFSTAEKRQLVLELVQIGIDNHGVIRSGGRWPGIGGHGSGRKLPILFAGKLLGDQLMLDVGRDFVSRRLVDGTSFSYFGEDSQTFFVEETSANVINFGGGGYTPFDLGMPEWGVSHVEAPWNDNRSWSGNPYRVCCTVNAWVGHVLTAHVMGLVGDWHHAALFGYTDRYMTIEPLGWTRSWASWVETMWDTHRSQY